MVDTFELPSACICNYKASFGFGFRKAHGYPSFPRRRPAPLKEVECSNGGEISQSLKNRFLKLPASPHKNSDNVKFPEDDRNTESRPRRHIRRFRRFKNRRGRTSFVPPESKRCGFVKICDVSTTTNGTRLGKHQKYPASTVRSLLRRHNTFKSPRQFKKLFGEKCEFGTEREPAVAFRFGFSFEETPVCRGYPRYIFPKVAKNIFGKQRFVVNTEEYRQGVTIVECHAGAKGMCINDVSNNIFCIS